MPAESGRRLVLVVDDDSTIVDFIDMALSYDGYSCVGAANGQEAVAKVVEANPSLVLLDISMPVMDGREFHRWLRSNGHSDIPVVVMTAGQKASRTCADLGAQGYLAKPFDLEELHSCVERWAR